MLDDSRRRILILVKGWFLSALGQHDTNGHQSAWQALFSIWILLLLFLKKEITWNLTCCKTKLQPLASWFENKHNWGMHHSPLLCSELSSPSKDKVRWQWVSCGAKWLVESFQILQVSLVFPSWHSLYEQTSLCQTFGENTQNMLSIQKKNYLSLFWLFLHST